MKNRTMGRAIGVAAVTTGLVLGVAGVASAYTEPSVDSCVDFKHTVKWYSTTQKVVGTNKCRTGTYSFVIYNWVPASQSWASSGCLSVGPGESAGWQWPRPGRNYYVRSC